MRVQYVSKNIKAICFLGRIFNHRIIGFLERSDQFSKTVEDLIKLNVASATN